ncbi:MAG: penicillin-binding protein 1A [Snowella sp.]|nr:penicillin-binding protein 1A [Snowella sp.]
MFKQLTQNLKKKTSQALHSVAEALEKQEPERVSTVSSPDPSTVATVSSEESSASEEQELQPASSSVLTKVAEPEPQEELTPQPESPVKRNRKRRQPRKALTFPQLVQTIPQTLSPIGSQVKKVSQHPRFWLFTGMGIGFTSSAIALGWGISVLEKNTQESVEEVLVYSPPGTLKITSSDGAILQEIGPVSHDKLKANAIPPLVKQAFIASEDRRFYDHRGVDPQGILRAAFSNLQAGDVVEGASTITQQLARLVFLNQDRNYGRKIREMRLAQKIEEKYTKNEILQQYLNLIYLGSGAYGVADAAHTYFSKTPEKLTLAEAATLAGIVPAPSRYSPIENKELATKRRNEVLNKMADAGFITPEQAQATILEPLTLKTSPLKRFNRQAPYFTDYVLKQLPGYVPEKVIQAGGLTVETTLNLAWQKHADEVVRKAVSQYGQWQRFSEAALVTIDPRTGQIKTMVGGKDFNNNQFNRVTQAKRQPGSTFKPILYAAAIAAGLSPDKTYLNAPFTVNGYTPENYGDKYTGAPMSLREALKSSVNVVAVRLLLDVGWNPVIKLARKMGIESPLEPTYSLALGSWVMTPLEMTSAYGTFPNKGVHVSSSAIKRVLDRHGRVIYQSQAKFTPALDPESNAISISLMRGVVTGGTGRPAQLGDRQVAGKTGTSDKARDLWFIGYIPQLVTGIWLGNDNNTPTKGASTTAAIMWQQFMVDAVKGMPVEYFPASPKKLEGRKPTIKAEPLKGRRINNLAIVNPAGNNDNSVNSSSNDDSRRSRRRRRRNRSSESIDNNQQPTETRRSRRRRRRVTDDNTQAQSSSGRSSSRRSRSQNNSTSTTGNSSLPAPPSAKKSE